jgi:hypothetical protein
MRSERPRYDQSNSVIAGANVVAVQVATGVRASTVTDRDGGFRFPYSAPARTQITAPTSSGRSRKPDPDRRRRFDLPFSLRVGTMADAVTVTSDGKVVNRPQPSPRRWNTPTFRACP